MTTQNHQPAGIPIGGQFAPTTHSEPSVHLSTVNALASRYEASRAFHEAHAQSEWTDEIRELHPNAEYAYVATTADRGGRYTAGMGLYDAKGNPIELDTDDGAAFEDSFNIDWDMSRHETEASQKIFTNKSGVFSLSSIKDRAGQMEAPVDTVADPFDHLTGMEKARAQADFARKLNDEAAYAYVQDLSGKLLAINPEFSRLYVNRKTDVEYGLTFALDRVEDIHGNVGEVDLAFLEDESFQDIYLDPYVTCDENRFGEDLFINLDTGE